MKEYGKSHFQQTVITFLHGGGEDDKTKELWEIYWHVMCFDLNNVIKIEEISSSKSLFKVNIL